MRRFSRVSIIMITAQRPRGPGKHWQVRALDSEGNRDRVSGVVNRDVALRLRSQPAPTQGNGEGDAPLFSAAV
jgi:hypothetical protein